MTKSEPCPNPNKTNTNPKSIMFNITTKDQSGEEKLPFETEDYPTTKAFRQSHTLQNCSAKSEQQRVVEITNTEAMHSHMEESHPFKTREMAISSPT